jgi:hypothetical protein
MERRARRAKVLRGSVMPTHKTNTRDSLLSTANKKRRALFVCACHYFQSK